MTRGWGYSLEGRRQVSPGPPGHEGLRRRGASIAGLLPGTSRAQALSLETVVRRLRLGVAPQRKGASFLWEPQAPPSTEASPLPPGPTRGLSVSQSVQVAEEMWCWLLSNGQLMVTWRLGPRTKRP